MSKTHWKKLQDPDYFGAFCIDEGKDMDVTITKVVRETVTQAGGKKEECTVAHLLGQKPWILNVTNSKTIERLTGSPYIEDWAGKTFTVFATDVKYAGEVVKGIRVRTRMPKQRELDTIKPGTEPYTKALNAVKTGKASVDQVAEKYPGMDVEQFKKDAAQR